jgi:hypothetical protein
MRRFIGAAVLSLVLVSVAWQFPEVLAGFDNKSNEIVDDLNAQGRSRWTRPP